MKNSKTNLKLCCALLAILLTLPILTSCTQNKTVVGTVNGNNVYYDELYFLVSNYKESVEKEADGSVSMMRAELDTLVKENIVTNYAILALCEEYGLKYSDIEDEIDDELEAYIYQNFNGSKSNFRKSCNEFGLSERYIRYTLGIDLLYDQLPQKYIEKGLLEVDEDKVIEYIEDNFIRTNHLVIFNDAEDDVEKNRAIINEAKALLDEGHDIHNLIKDYSEDFTSDTDGSGFYITKGTMVEEYENAAFELEIGEYTDVIELYGENNYGEYVSCFYIIQRLKLDDAYIEKNFESLKSDYYSSVIYEDVQKTKSTLEFKPNDKYKELDLTDLPKSADLTIVIVVAIICVIAIASTVTVIIIKSRLKKKNASYKNKSARRK